MKSASSLFCAHAAFVLACMVSARCVAQVAGFGSPWIAAEQPSVVAIIEFRDGHRHFPATWLTSPILARATALPASEVKRSHEVTVRALQKYPRALLSTNLEQAVLVGELSFRGIKASGTNSRTRIFLANEGLELGYSDDWLERVVHAEFSSILLRNFPQQLDRKSWSSQNPVEFDYGASGVDAIRRGASTAWYTEGLFADGFLNEYAQSTFENDFNAFAAELWLGSSKVWTLAEHHERLNRKLQLTLAFYHALHPSLDRSFFEGLVPAAPTGSGLSIDQDCGDRSNLVR